MSACQDPEKGKLDNRVMDYWNAKINKDFKVAYQYLSPGWRENESENSYIRRIGASTVKWLAVEIKRKECKQTDLCKLFIEIIYEYQFKGVGSKKIKVPALVGENWILKSNVWYHIPTETKLQ